MVNSAMKAQFNNSYSDYSDWINSILSSPKKKKNINFDETIYKASCLPKPDTDARYQELIDSGLGFLLCDLAYILGDHEKLSKKCVSKKRLNSYLENLWNIWEGLFIRCCWYDYFKYLIDNEQFQKRLSNVNYHNNKLFNKCSGCQKSFAPIPSNDRLPPLEYWEKLSEACYLSRANITGCEGFIYASENLKNEYVFEKVYHHWKEPNIERLQLLWIPFITCAGELKRTDILSEILHLMIKSYRELDFVNIIVLLNSACNSDATEVIDYIKDLNSPDQWNLLTPYNPVLDFLINSLSNKDGSEATWKRELWPFEGEFWIDFIKKYFKENNSKSAVSYNEHKRVLRFNEKNVRDWHRTLCLAQETFVREFRTQMYEEFERQFSHYNYLNDDKFLSEIISGNVSLSIKNYQQNINNLAFNINSEFLKNEDLEKKFLPFIDYSLINHLNFFINRENYYRWKNNKDFQASFFIDADKLLKNINPEKVIDEEWQYFLKLTASRIQNNFNLNLSKIFLSEFHSLKRKFIEKYEKVFQNGTLNTFEKNELLLNAREFIKNIQLLIPKYKITNPQGINIIPLIKKHLMIDSVNAKFNIKNVESSVYVSGYDGICDDYLIPILNEIRSNVKKAILKIQKQEKRYYQIDLSYGQSEYSSFLILSVSNNYLPNNNDPGDDPVSTGIGLKNIQHYATFFQKDELQGWAQYKKEKTKEYGCFTVQIYFPLWEKEGTLNA